MIRIYFISVLLIFSHITSFALDSSFLAPPSMSELSTQPIGRRLLNAYHQNKKLKKEVSEAALPAQFDVSGEGEYQYLKLVLVRVFNMFPDIFRERILKDLKKFTFPATMGISKGELFLDGSLKMGVCLDPLYFIEVFLHETGHLFQKELAEQPHVHISAFALGGHIYINGLLLYLLYPVELQQLAHQSKAWLAVRNYWKRMFGGREFSDKEARLLLDFINEQRENIINSVNGYSVRARDTMLRQLKEEQGGYLKKYGFWNEVHINQQENNSAKLLQMAN